MPNGEFMKIISILMFLMSMNAFSQEKDCAVEVVFPFGTELVEDEEVVSSMNGAIESLPVSFVYSEIDKALADKNIGISERGQHADFKIIVGFTGMLNEGNAVLTDAYIKTRGYERTIEAREKAGVFMLLSKENKRVKKLFTKALKDFSFKIDECFQ